MIRIFLGVVRLQVSEALIERKGDEIASGKKEAITEGKTYNI